MTPNWEKFPDATHFTPKIDDSGMWCDVYWRMEDGFAVRAWQIESDFSAKVFERPSLLADTMTRMIARPDPEAVAKAQIEDLRAIIERTKLMGGDIAAALHSHGYRKKETP
jgi:hypothetical protein